MGRRSSRACAGKSLHRSEQLDQRTRRNRLVMHQRVSFVARNDVRVTADCSGGQRQRSRIRRDDRQEPHEHFLQRRQLLVRCERRGREDQPAQRVLHAQRTREGDGASHAVTQHEHRGVQVLAGTLAGECAEIGDQVREAIDVGARTGRSSVPAMIDGVNGIVVLHQLAGERLVATAVLRETVCHHDDAARGDLWQPGLGIKFDAADTGGREFTVFHASRLPCRDDSPVVPVRASRSAGPRTESYFVAGGRPAGTFVQA